MQTRILLIEDDPGTGAALAKVLNLEGYSVQLVSRGDDGLKRAQEESFDVVVTDFKLPGLSGLELIDHLHRAAPKLPIIMMTAHGTTETAIEATKLGACEYLPKPFEADELLARVGDAVANARLMMETVELGESKSNGYALLGHSRPMQEVYKTIGRVASTPVTVLIRGATGTGKELVARAIYNHSDRSHQPFIAVNCAAIPRELLESELFGHERGSFTGAHNRRIGRFEQASGGTIFLDEIGDLHLDTQAKLLRVLQERCIQRVGGDALIPVDVRVLAATHRDLDAALRENEFREDLFYRLSVVTVEIPPLRDRIEDIPALVRFFLQKHGTELNIASPSIQPGALAVLQRQPWPGNVRQLENVVREALLLARPFGIAVSHVEHLVSRNAPSTQARDQTHAEYIAQILQRARSGQEQDIFSRLVSDLEPELYAQAINLAQGNQAKAARWLGVTRLKMREKLIQFGLHPSKGGR